jgi:hypothetical protein
MQSATGAVDIGGPHGETACDRYIKLYISADMSALRKAGFREDWSIRLYAHRR